MVTLGLVVLKAASLAQTDTGTAPFLIISSATLAGAIVAAATAWSLTASIPDFWRRGIASAIAMTLGFVIAAVTAPLDMIGGLKALIAYTVLLAAASAVSYRKAVRAGT